MAYDFGALDASVSAAVGDDEKLAREIRAAFIEGARSHVDLLSRARCDANWRVSCHKLNGLAASFGATGLMQAAGFALESAPGDPYALRKVQRALAAIDG